MGDIEKTKKIFGIVWVIGFVFLWITFPFYPGDILFWMWLAIIWTISGGVIQIIFFMGESKKNEKIIIIIWIVILVILWTLYPLFLGNVLA